MDLANILQYDSSKTFNEPNPDGSLSLMDQNVKKRYPAEAVSTNRATSEQKKRAQNTDPKLWNIIKGIYGFGNLDISLASIPNGGYAEIIDRNTGEACIATATMAMGTIKPVMQFAACEMNELDVYREYSTTRHGTALLAAHIAWAYGNDMEIKLAVDTLKNLIIENPNAEEWKDAAFCEKVGTLMCQITSNVYYSYKNEYDIASNLKRLRDSDVKNINILKISHGETKKVKVATKIEANMGMFNLNPNRVLTEEEKALVPNIPSTFKWEKWHLTTAQEIQESSMFSEPFRVIMLEGPSGTGKSQGASAIAHLLGRPRVIFTCDPDTDEFKLVGSTMPNTEGVKAKDVDIDSLCKAKGLPTFEDIAFDFKASYVKLFGEEPSEFAMESDCYKELSKRLNLNDNSDFVFVKSNIIKALENGWLVEIQEPTVIKRASVLVALNAMLDCDNDSAMITLPTGEVIKRHPEAVVVYTTNADYAGCQSIQQSVLSRIDIIREIENPETAVLVQRAMSNTGCKDKKSLEQMAKVINEINNYCKNKDITDGVCGPREYQNWIKKAMLLERRKDENSKLLTKESICSAAFSTIISHISQISEDREDVITAVIGKTYSQSDLQLGRSLYEAGVA